MVIYKEPCEGYKASLKVALEHSRKALAEEDGCLPEEVENFHPSEEELKIKQMGLFDD